MKSHLHASLNGDVGLYPCASVAGHWALVPWAEASLARIPPPSSVFSELTRQRPGLCDFSCRIPRAEGSDCSGPAAFAPLASWAVGVWEHSSNSPGDVIVCVGCCLRRVGSLPPPALACPRPEQQRPLALPAHFYRCFPCAPPSPQSGTLLPLFISPVGEPPRESHLGRRDSPAR